MIKRVTRRQRRRNINQVRNIFLLTISLLLVFKGVAVAQEPISWQEAYQSLQVTIDTVWVLLAGMLVVFMNAGFAMLEAGMCRSKNVVNILAKNLIDFGIVSLAFWSLGFGLMFGDGNDWVGLQGFFLGGLDTSPLTGEAYRGIFSSLSWTGVPLAAKFFFQLAFAGTAATIVSGAVAERISFLAYFIFSWILCSLIYPVVGHWIWGGGFLNDWGFWDFAGSTVVHIVGGCAALAGAYTLGPRQGRYDGNSPGIIPGHDLSLATLGGMILWLGWFGFNPGSTMAADADAISHIVVATNIAAAAGAVGAAVTSWVVLTKPNLSMIINGVLAGLVSITASCAYVGFGSAVAIGLVGGIIAVFAANFFDWLKIDDPVGAIPVHFVGGIWGTLAVSLFSVGPGVNPWHSLDGGPPLGVLLGGGVQQVGIQLVGILVVCLFTGLASLTAWLLIEYSFGLRVSPKAEELGLDISEHGLEAYPEFKPTSGKHL
ncbi:MAG: ammonium transporter [Leptolyngbyaceae bacterium]|nr:ammonium transporter [Leptolyngbyaceae bacterium]